MHTAVELLEQPQTCILVCLLVIVGNYKKISSEIAQSLALANQSLSYSVQSCPSCQVMLCDTEANSPPAGPGRYLAPAQEPSGNSGWQP